MRRRTEIIDLIVIGILRLRIFRCYLYIFCCVITWKQVLPCDRRSFLDSSFGKEDTHQVVI